ncbi:MAG: alternative ribosome rescue aminoacyl-tRNA hydrolase ArfB [Pirellulales bacterium]
MTVPATLRINSQIAIPRSELRFRFVRSSGPGGQNVNKVASKAVLHWNAAESPSISDEVRGRLQSRFARRINDRGELVLTSQRFRDQSKNVDDCLAKLAAIVVTAAKRPRLRKKTRPPKAVKEARLHEKRRVSENKQRRRIPPDDR